MATRQRRSNSVYSAILALTVTSAWSIISIYGTRPVEEIEGRRPASVRLNVEAPVGMDVLHLACWDRPPGRLDSPRAHFVRLSGPDCGAKGPIEVTNHTNGFNATVFDVNATDHTTDFIPLEHGANAVEIAVGSGERRRTFALTLSH